ncbi:MAG: 6-carboxytetrahydropterin synthase QueD [Omnitrophica WOR_2 bacterium RIFOXYB2_FULL_38_16]|nr:MAG: 6-carboxytetrahydropterin synthase QueD [Omnitrophica WOR_2 bacterium GWA2_37_7]OGX50692.1 MAG: 6-carboxytetrahydropterin synthase QueD [Omnitrophica WOR_2 bacterium RIFOXYA2_FULL_38_17]OGX53233.1 MAG: 6-carboxytetrahydropterin synthase QueD [Omnitrophica WOR_2 bacterium RIFOXYA12_FULL_38_10]OGX57404.1 MAG: 6-carboxytetrahydropterin synthase QueD [Omnitrophica WOR_2 bacterium RIFOXYC2_FULL_38_12]OGX60324.1 MAG: 6-carboxytetrahydropterin synthase QueD [Omnitrophica WOR_2 bacterium RIFOXY
MFELKIKGEFSSAHLLREYDGKCKNLHGHNWKVDIEVYKKELDPIGMVADFGFLKSKMNEVLEILDHRFLNDLDYFKQSNPTSENIAKYIYAEYAKVIDPIKVKSVSVWESDSACVKYYEDSV